MSFRNPLTSFPAAQITGQIVGSQIADDAITAPKINTAAVTADALAALSVTGPAIASDAVTAAKIAAGSVTTLKLAAGAVTANEIAANAVTSTKISATAIDGKTITGAFIRTAATGKRWELKSTPANTLNGYTGLASEVTPGYLTIDVDPLFGTTSQLTLGAASLGFGAAELVLEGPNGGPTSAAINADSVTISGDTTIAGDRVYSRDTTGDAIGRTRSPGAFVRKSDTPTIANATATVVSWSGPYDGRNADTTVWDTPTPTRFIAPVDGRYSVSGSFVFASNATGYRWINLRKNAAGVATAGNNLLHWSVQAANGEVTAVPFALTDLFLAAGDYVELFAKQSSGAALAVGFTGGAVSTFGMTFVGLV